MVEKKPLSIPVYNYDGHENFYINEEIADLDRAGTPLLPACATFLEPPSKITDGAEIAVFDVTRNQWVMRPNDYWRPVRKRRAVRFNHTLTGDLSITQLPSPFPVLKYKGVPRVIAGSTIAMSLSGRLHYLNARAQEIQRIHSQSANGFSSELLHYLKISSEDLVTQMKRFVDDIFIQEWMELERSSRKFQDSKVVRLQAVNEIEKLPPGKTKDYLLAMRNDDSEFFQTITDLRNSFSHHLTVAESYWLIGLDHPTVNTIYMKNGDLNTIELVEVYVEDLTKSLNKFILRTFNL